MFRKSKLNFEKYARSPYMKKVVTAKGGPKLNSLEK
jgi:hypothetical protein